jgi:hypothetical protein
MCGAGIVGRPDRLPPQQVYYYFKGFFFPFLILFFSLVIFFFPIIVGERDVEMNTFILGSLQSFVIFFVIGPINEAHC